MNGPRFATWLSAFTLATCGFGPAALAQGDPNAPPEVAGMQVLTRGPVHEAFAEPVVFDPKACPVIPKQPPPQVEELPPDQQPEGTNVQWIPGYWSWDDERNDYLWVSGIWRDVPPGRQWVPGYWSEAQGGFQWIAGAWVPTAQEQVEYLAEPPQSLEVGPNGPSPSADATWAPGCWYWQETRYVWRPGFWVPFQPHWLWVPAHFVWTPNGYLYVNGYWDHPLDTRGLAFAPVYFQQPLYAQPNFVYTPSVGLLATALASSLFVRPSYQQYCFGDYYAATNFNSGIYPWYSYHQSRYGYDPLFSHYAAVHTRRDPRWVNGLHEEYLYRRNHPEFRPARTFVQQQTIVNNVTNVNVTNVNVRNVTKVQNLVIGRPIHQMATLDRGPATKQDVAFRQNLRFERIDEARRKVIAQQAGQLNQFRQQRIRQEQEFARRPQSGPQAKEPGKRANFPDQPRRMDLPRSPVASLPLRDRDQPGREANAATKAARQANAANAAQEVIQAREATKAARQANAANAAREAMQTREANVATKAARQANAANAAREAMQAREANAAREVMQAREANAATKAARQANAANAAREAMQAREANAAAQAARQANAANAAREANAARQANAANAAREAMQAREANAAAQAARQANAANAAREANAARQANAANARAQMQARHARDAAPPPVPTQPNLDLNRRPGTPNQFRQQRHEPDPNQLPPQFRRGMQNQGRPNANLEGAAVPPNVRAAQMIHNDQPRHDGTPKAQKKRQRD
ncbi:YXWGXW repeat-containing protein [Singulisphaera sp. GP187]|uniref:YXWGXW repeat-containing protein n=1 Tax=Singulisphaera sp. GP187 TaxID=1882752 RepID=UPI0009281819|nr:YXWGXW repeat-containing protein [Singulisphaera sp. GP187]SIO66335.1 YXWGXW repeat-containing protein [Singulisphaera sp. GP187]